MRILGGVMFGSVFTPPVASRLNEERLAPRAFSRTTKRLPNYR
jgi:hypothetical protein